MWLQLDTDATSGAELFSLPEHIEFTPGFFLAELVLLDL
jgi:hypothetical protein